MHLTPGYKTLTLTSGTVALRGWDDRVADAYLLDLLVLTNTLTHIRTEWAQYRAADVERNVWPAFWRLVNASLDGTPLPHRVTWADRLRLLDALWELNDLEDSDPKLTALEQRARAFQGRLTHDRKASSGISA